MADKDKTINKKLNKIYNKEKYEKCLKKAISYNRKYPQSSVPEYYMSRVNYKFYTSKGKNLNRGFIDLRNAIRYSNSLPDSSYLLWKDTLRDSLRDLIHLNNDTLNSKKIIKKALKFYTENYLDTLDLYYIYYPVEEKVLIGEDLKNFSKLDSIRYSLLSFAKKQEGILYSYAGEKPETGFDCSGFTKYVYSEIGVELPHNAQKQSDIKVGNIDLSDAQPGDLIFFGSQYEEKHYTQHAGIIYSIRDEEVKVIHCVSNGVSIDGNNSSWAHYWKDKVLFVKSLSSFLE
jgi:cell wall-associated NlpC family hydrolase